VSIVHTGEPGWLVRKPAVSSRLRFPRPHIACESAAPTPAASSPSTSDTHVRVTCDRAEIAIHPRNEQDVVDVTRWKARMNAARL
jgi:hypothetical protein